MYMTAFTYVQRVPKGGTQFHTCLLERLQPGQVMLARVRACNSVGASEWSEDTHFRTLHSVTPGPACVTLNSATHSSLHISWTAAPAPSGAHEAQAVEYVVQFPPAAAANAATESQGLSLQRAQCGRARGRASHRKRQLQRESAVPVTWQLAAAAFCIGARHV